MRRLAAVLAAAVGSLAPAAAPALEPRFDHREQHGPVVEFAMSRDTVTVSGVRTATTLVPVLRVGWGADLIGDGDEFIASAEIPLSPPDVPDGASVEAAVDVRYRGYFGTEEFKTFFELGLWSSVAPNLALGPLAGFGAGWDFDRTWGLFGTARFTVGVGEARIGSFSASVGIQARF